LKRMHLFPWWLKQIIGCPTSYLSVQPNINTETCSISAM
jgi:hypothetical protein